MPRSGCRCRRGRAASGPRGHGRHGDPAGAEPALVARLRVRCLCRWPPLPGPGRGRRLHAECLCLVADTSLSGPGSARELDRVIAARKRPAMIVRTMAPNSPAWRSCAGRRNSRSNGTTSRRASRSRTPSSRASTAGCATSAQRDAVLVPERGAHHARAAGGATTTPKDLTQGSAG